MRNIGTGLVLALATLARAQEHPLAANLEADVASVKRRIPSQRAALRREFGIDIERLGASDDDASQDYCQRNVHRKCYEQGHHWNRNLDDDVAVFAPSPPGSCRTCAYSGPGLRREVLSVRRVLVRGRRDSCQRRGFSLCGIGLRGGARFCYIKRGRGAAGGARRGDVRGAGAVLGGGARGALALLLGPGAGARRLGYHHHFL